jgi:hypothetical protein
MSIAESNTVRASQAVGVMLDVVFEWEAKTAAFMATGDDDADVVVTHDCRGRMIEMSIRPGLQEELTVGELEDVVNAEIARNAARAAAGLNAIRDEFLSNFGHIPDEVANHPVAARFASALHAAERLNAQHNVTAGS